MGSADYADLVVVGAGVAGLTAALTAAAAGLDVVVLNKGRAWHPDVAEQSTSTFYAQGGIAVVDPADPDDSVDLHVSDTVRAGAGLTRGHPAREIAADGWAAVSRLVDWGARFDTGADGRFLRTREGGHSVRRIIHAGGDATGAQVQAALGQAVLRAGIRVHDETWATAVLTAGGRAVGVAYRDAAGEGVLAAESVLLATGGLGHVYAATTNPGAATGDGLALALRAGARVADLEFIQFHPTMLYLDGGSAQARGRRTLVSEAVRGEGGRLVDAAGDAVTAGVPLGDLAPRDVVARAVTAAMRRTGAPCVYLDLTPIPDFAARFPTVTAGVRAAGLDVAAGRLPVVPGAHYLCGGVVTDAEGRTSVPGVLAAGEVARTGLHGANRLASNSLLEGLVLGRRVGEVAAAASADRGAAARVAAARVAAGGSGAGGPAVLPAVDRTILQDAMSQEGALRRDRDGLTGLARLLDDAPGRRQLTCGDAEDAALTLAARAVVAAALLREESRGCHYRADFPESAPSPDSRAFTWSESGFRPVAW